MDKIEIETLVEKFEDKLSRYKKTVFYQNNFNKVSIAHLYIASNLIKIRLYIDVYDRKEWDADKSYFDNTALVGKIFDSDEWRDIAIMYRELGGIFKNPDPQIGKISL